MLREKLKNVPTKAGVYLLKDEKGEILYVGKALSLRKRLRSYFQKSPSSPKLSALLEKVKDFEWILTDSEAEAYLLECNLIKRYRPRYNVRLRDDKSYPYIKIITSMDFPPLILTREPQEDKALYFGPYTNVGAAQRVLRLLHRIFPLRRCRKNFKARQRPCLYYELGECSAPCSGKISKEEYAQLIKGACLFLQGNYQALVEELTQKMKEASQKLEFERAAKLRDTIRAIKKLSESQKVVAFTGEEADFIALAREEEEACALVFQVREGKVVGEEHFFLRITPQEEEKNILTSFLKEYYGKTSSLPRRIYTHISPREPHSLSQWLSLRKGSRVKITVPKKGEKLKLIELVKKNALAHLKEEKTLKEEEVLLLLKDSLGLKNLPSHIEGFDISNLGEEAVGSVVVFEGGKPKKSEYRRFRIKWVEGQDDYAMLAEVLSRRLRRLLEEKKPLPDLILVDGGRGQVMSCWRVLKSMGLEEVPLLGLAKKLERIFFPQRTSPLALPWDSPALHLLQRVRDEAHRFAHAYQRYITSRKTKESFLDGIPGVGEKLKRLILSHFSSLEELKKKGVKALLELPGVGEKTARKIMDCLRED